MSRLLIILFITSSIFYLEVFAGSHMVATQYDVDYQGADQSMYNKRFGKDKVIIRERDLIVECYNKIAFQNKNLKIIRILDFGCGDGRMLSVIESLAKNNLGIKIELLAYDISKRGLKIFEDRLRDKNYHRIKQSHWANNNLHIILLNNIDNSILTERPIHFIFSIFAVFGHIQGHDTRQKLLGKLVKYLDNNGIILINVSTVKSLPQEVAAYDLIRKQYRAATKHKQISLANSLRRCSIKSSVATPT